MFSIPLRHLFGRVVPAIVCLVLLLLSGCDKPRLLTHYMVINETPLYHHVTLSGTYRQSVQPGDTLLLEQVFSNCISVDFHGHTRYLKLNDVREIVVKPEERIVSESSPLPPLVQQFMLKYANFWRWPFWAITAGLAVILFLMFSIGMGTQISYSVDHEKEAPGLELFPVFSFGIGVLLGVWHFFLPETTQGAIYHLDFLRVFEGEATRTAWFLFGMGCLFVLLNLWLLIRMLVKYFSYAWFLYPFYTLMGATALVTAVFMATASMVVLIVATMIYFGFSMLGGAASGLANAGSGSSSAALSQEQEIAKRDREALKRRQLNQAEWHRVYKGENVDPNVFR